MSRWLIAAWQATKCFLNLFEQGRGSKGLDQVSGYEPVLFEPAARRFSRHEYNGDRFPAGFELQSAEKMQGVLVGQIQENQVRQTLT
jgi:hypothetical protein